MISMSGSKLETSIINIDSRLIEIKIEIKNLLKIKRNTSVAYDRAH